ncbi:hypothetical protein C0995_004472 [Termitomyces sp. Mi166|nr:hypothetical protein C0995_004472 [Termitomyces sp. Mi166\
MDSRKGLWDAWDTREGNRQEAFSNEWGEIIIEMIRTFGKLPDRWWTQWEQRDKFFGEDGTLKAGFCDVSGEPRTVDLKERLRNIRRNDEKGQKELSGDLEALELVLEKMLRVYQRNGMTESPLSKFDFAIVLQSPPDSHTIEIQSTREVSHLR